MDNSIYIALSRQTGLFRDMNVTANNIANVNTTGYNSEKMLFKDYVVDAGNHSKMSFAQDISSYRDLQDGPMKETGSQLDFAISGRGYFAIETPTGTRYTRAGNFKIDPNGTLVTVEGFPVQDTAGQRIEFDENVKDIEVNAAGDIAADGVELAQLGVFKFQNEQKMERLAGALYRSDEIPEPLDREAGDIRVVQGVLEGSNSDSILQLTHMIEVERGVSGLAKFIDVQYDLQRKASSTYGRQS